MILHSQDSWDSVLDGSKLFLHMDRVAAWESGNRIAPITVDMSLTRACNYACGFCAAQYQENDRKIITEATMERFLTDCAEIGVKGISLVSDGESTISPCFEFTVRRGKELGIDMAVGSNGYLITADMSARILQHLTYLRINFSGGTRERYAEIMGVKPASFDRVVHNIESMVWIKRLNQWPCTIGIQFVLMPEFADQIIPFARLGKDLGVDYAVIKHCSDTPEGTLGVDYSKYVEFEGLLREAESYSTDIYKCVVKWSKINANGGRNYQRCFGPPFILQISGSGLVAPCGGLFTDKFRKFHLGSIVDQSFKEIVQSERYWEVMRHLSSDQFNAQKTCDSLCLQTITNEVLNDYKTHGKAIPIMPTDIPHRNFI